MERFVTRLTNNRVLGPLLRPLLQVPMAGQEKLDLYDASLLLLCRKWCKERGVKVPSKEAAKEFYDEADKLLENEELRKFVQSELNKQTIELFENIEKYQAAVEKQMNRLHHKSSKPETSTLSQYTGFEVERRPSLIPNSGDGLFLKNGSVPAGTLVALFPGVVHLAEYTTKKGYVESLLPDDNYMLTARFDGVVIDGRTSSQVPFNPFGMAQFINHVPMGKHPNIVQVAYNFPSDPLGFDAFPKSLKKYIPHSYAKPPTLLGTVDRSACMHSLVMLTSRPIQADEELLMDYRLNPTKLQLPEWYKVYDEKVVARRNEEIDRSASGRESTHKN